MILQRLAALLGLSAKSNGGASALPTLVGTAQPVSQDLLVRYGDYCESLMRNDTFNEIIAEYRRQNVEYILTTKPQETSVRESVYLSMQGVTDLLSLMKMYVHERNAIIEANTNENQSSPSSELEDDSPNHFDS